MGKIPWTFSAVPWRKRQISNASCCLLEKLPAMATSPESFLSKDINHAGAKSKLGLFQETTCLISLPVSGNESSEMHLFILQILVNTYPKLVFVLGSKLKMNERHSLKQRCSFNSLLLQSYWIQHTACWIVQKWMR